MNSKNTILKPIKVELCMYASHGETKDAKVLSVFNFIENHVYPNNWNNLSLASKKQYYYKHLYKAILLIAKLNDQNVLQISKSLNTLSDYQRDAFHILLQFDTELNKTLTAQENRQNLQ
jgi:hypothetical protein